MYNIQVKYFNPIVYRGYVYISKQVFGSENHAICSIHTSTLKIQFPKNHTPTHIKTPKNTQNHFDTHFDKTH